MYVLRVPDERTRRITIRRLSARGAFHALSANTFNRRVTEAERLKTHFAHAADLARQIPVMSLTYPRALDALSDVSEAVTADLHRRLPRGH
jgi:hypothetical protein